MSEQGLLWCDVPVTVDDATVELFEMSPLDQDPEQKPAFRVTSSTAALVKKDFELYKPSLERMADDWREEKKSFMQKQTMIKKDGKE
jgi:hypothetical protein